MKNSFLTVCLTCCIVVLLASCSGHLGGDKQVQAPLEPLSCIAVVPASTSVDKDDTVNYSRAKELEKGAALATRVLADVLGGHGKVMLLSSSQMATLVPEVSGGISGMVSALGQKLNCDAVLVTVVQRFKQREGTEYASDDPASAEFNMVLRHANKGTVLWSADFQETQESFLSNILSYNKMQSRGFKWITVEQLLQQGIRERIAECPYL